MWHKGLLYKLEAIGVRDPLLSWFCSYLSDRKQRVVIDGQSSDWTGTNSGVPQGSVLGPYLFLIYINAQSDCLLYVVLMWLLFGTLSLFGEDLAKNIAHSTLYHCFSVPVFLFSYVPSVPLYPVFLCSSVPLYPLFLCTQCTYCSSVFSVPLFLCTYCCCEATTC